MAQIVSALERNQAALAKHSDAWQEGYACLKPRCNNPYKTQEPGTVLMHHEWVLGWECRFFGESP